jgi:hypothetical protein
VRPDEAVPERSSQKLNRSIGWPLLPAGERVGEAEDSLTLLLRPPTGVPFSRPRRAESHIALFEGERDGNAEETGWRNGCAKSSRAQAMPVWTTMLTNRAMIRRGMCVTGDRRSSRVVFGADGVESSSAVRSCTHPTPWTGLALTALPPSTSRVWMDTIDSRFRTE